MNLNVGQYSISDYLGMLERKEIVINRDYQRSNNVWPAAAQSYFIDTILEGYPTPKIYLYQTFNEKTRRPYKELVDGQQRTTTIQDFYNNKFALSSAAPKFKGLKYNDLDEEAQRMFLSYQLEHSIIVSGSRSELLEMFRRMNSYTAPLKEAEKRHSEYQGEFKWFVVEQTDKLSSFFVEYNVLTDKIIARMGDAEFIAELILVLDKGIYNKNSKSLKDLYKEYDEEFSASECYSHIISSIFNEIQHNLYDLIDRPLFRSYNVHSLFCAYAAIWFGFPGSEEVFRGEPSLKNKVDYSLVIPKLIELCDAYEEQDDEGIYAEFVEACNYSTTKKPQRIARTKFLVTALLGG